MFETISPGSLLLNDIIGHLGAILELHIPQEARRVQRLSSKFFVQARFILKSGTTEEGLWTVSGRSQAAQLIYSLESEMEGESNREREDEEGRGRGRKRVRERPLENSYWFILSHELIPKGNSLISQPRSSAPLCV